MSRRLSYFVLACAMVAVVGCSMNEAPARGEHCPPWDASINDFSPGELHSICLGGGYCPIKENGVYSETFTSNFCPLDFPVCVKNYDTGTYYCMKRCEGDTPKSCFGDCISAEQDCECTEKDSKCESGKLYQCEGHIWKATSCPQGASCKNSLECGECQTGAQKCEGNEFSTCVNAMWIIPQKCEGDASCFNESICGGCKNNESTCAEGKLYHCIDGSWDEGDNCAHSDVCKDTSTCGDCSKNATECINGRIKTCSETGIWGNEKDCKVGVCKNDQECGECVPHTTKCNNGEHQTCTQKGEWDSVTKCNTGVCKSATECGDCGPEGKTCSGNTLKSCKNGSWTESVCSVHNNDDSNKDGAIMQTCQDKRCCFPSSKQPLFGSGLNRQVKLSDTAMQTSFKADYCCSKHAYYYISTGGEWTYCTDNEEPCKNSNCSEDGYCKTNCTCTCKIIY